MKPTRIEISYKTIVFTVFFLLFLWFLYAIKSVLLAMFIAIIIMSALNPVVTALEKRKIPRPLAIMLLFIFIFLLFAGVVASIVPASVTQTRSLIIQIPKAIEHLGLPTIDQRVISDQLGSLPGNIAKFIIGAFSNIIAIFTLFVVSYYLLAERAHVHKHFVAFFGNEDIEKRAERFVNNLESIIGGWVRGQISLMIIIGVMTYIGLNLLEVGFTLPLSIIAGLLEIVPSIGPTIAMIPAVLIATSTSPVTALATLALYFLIQQFENNIIVPKIMQKTVGVKPLTTIISLMIGIKLAGVLGAVLAVPGYLMLRVFLEEFIGSKSSSSPNKPR